MVNASPMCQVGKSISMKSVNKYWVMPIYTPCLKVCAMIRDTVELCSNGPKSNGNLTSTVKTYDPQKLSHWFCIMAITYFYWSLQIR